MSQYFRLEFQPIADLLTDGDRNGVIEVTLGPFPEGGGSIGAFKQTVFQNFVPEIHTEVFVPLFSGIDLSGYQIEAIAMTIRDLRIVYDASTNITSIRGAYSIDILGRPVEGIVVDVDIRPTSSTNPVQPGEQGVLPVAILTTDTFDATTVDVSSVCFGDAEAPGERACMEVHGTGHSEDVDGDGHLDLVLHFKTQETGIDSGDTTACLTGRTQTGGPIRGCDSLRTVWSRTSWTSF